MAKNESPDGAGGAELYWLVDDAEAAFREPPGRAEVSPPLKQMALGKVFGVKGLAGRPRSLVEVNEETEDRIRLGPARRFGARTSDVGSGTRPAGRPM